MDISAKFRLPKTRIPDNSPLGSKIQALSNAEEKAAKTRGRESQQDHSATKDPKGEIEEWVKNL